jgi:hypothetical protein
MIQVTAGHLGSGTWCFKEVDGITILANVQHFNRHDEFRIGPSELISYDIEKAANNQQPAHVTINFTQDRYCQALIPADELHKLETMRLSHESAPAFKRDNPIWVSLLLAFVIACIGFQFMD